MEKKTAKKKRKQHGGWPKRERAAAVIRISPAIIQWYSERADAAGRSRNVFMEMWLGALREVVEENEEALKLWKEQGHAEDGVGESMLVEAMGRDLVRRVQALGLMTASINEGFRFRTLNGK